MYCKNCGAQVVEGAKFCSQCGTSLSVSNMADVTPPATDAAGVATGDAAAVEPSAESAAQTEPVAPAQQSTYSAGTQTGAQTSTAGGSVSTESSANASGEETVTRPRPKFDDIQWNVADYPDQNAIEKTDEIDFNWNTDSTASGEKATEVRSEAQAAAMDNTEPSETAEDVLRGDDLNSMLFGEEKGKPAQENLSASERIDKFYTFNKKNEEFQQLLNREYSKIKGGNAIGSELSQAEARASERFDQQHRPENATMEDFLKAEGVVKPYQPKAFESDVLDRIAAQEAEKEAKRLEEEARQAAIEEARREAEAQRLAEEARVRAEEESKRAAEEARIKAEEEAKRVAEEEARIRSEAEARVRAEEEARLKAEADLKAAQEAARIKAQQEARLAAEAEAKFQAEQERRQLEEQEAQRKLEEERANIAQQANQAVAREEARKVLEQTARMREEEAAKIKAAVAGLRAGAAAATEHKDDAPAPRKEVQEAHEATKNQINEMARARSEFFAGLEDKPATQSASESAPTQQASDHPVTGRNTMLTNDLTATRTMDKEAMRAGLRDDTLVVRKDDQQEESSDQQNAQPESTAQPEEYAQTEQAGSITDEDDAFFNSLDAAAAAGAVGAAAGIAAMAAGTEEASADAASAAESTATDAPESIPEYTPQQARPIDYREENVEDLASSFSSVEEPLNATNMEDTQVFSDMSDISGAQDMTNTQRFDPNSFEPVTSSAEDMEQTMILQKSHQQDAFAANDFDTYGEEEARNYINQQAQNRNDSQQAVDDFYADEDVSQLSKKEQKQRAKEQKRLEKQRAKEEKARLKHGGAADDLAEGEDADGKRGGKGRIVLKIVLVVLIVILAAEVAGIVIRSTMPQSKAAEFIDTQLNKVIQLITGDDTEYSVIAAQVRTEPMEDKTDLISAQKSKDNDGNIKTIVYSSDLSYDQEKYGKVSDLVLSQPMTQVEWGRDEDNYPVYYDEQVVGRIIEFESQRYNLMTSGDEKVLSMIDEDTNLYKEVAALKNKGAGEFSKLEIGEIREAGGNYCVWVRETIGGTTTEKVYSMYPEKKFVMKLDACYTV